MPDHPIVLVSEGFCGVTGYPRNQIVGRNCRFLQGLLFTLTANMPRSLIIKLKQAQELRLSQWTEVSKVQFSLILARSYDDNLVRHGLNTEEGCTELLLNYRMQDPSFHALLLTDLAGRNGEPFYCVR